MELEEYFDEIADKALEAARKVKCDSQDYIEGLKVIEQRLREELEMAEEEQESRKSGA